LKIREVISSGESIEEVKRKICEMLGESEDDIEFEVMEYPSKRLFGVFGGKLAKVKGIFREYSVGEAACEFLKEVLMAMGLDSLTVNVVSETSMFCEININGEDITYTFGKHGEVLDSLQYLSQLVGNTKGKSDGFCKVRLESGNYRQQRKNTLSFLAQQTAFRAIKLNQPVKLEPMRAYERKIIHSAVDEICGVSSWVEGEGSLRYVVIAPNNIN